MSKKIILCVTGTEISFSPDKQLYCEYIGSVARGDIANASHNFVMQSVAENADKQILRDLDDDNPSVMMTVAGALVQEYAPRIEVTVKK